MTKQRAKRLQTLQEEVAKQTLRLAEQQKLNSEILRSHEVTEERTQMLSDLEELTKKKQRLQEEIAQYSENDPALLEAMDHDTRRAVEGANRWTDNVFALRSFCSKKFNMDGRDFDKAFQIPQDFDYVS